MYQFNIVQDDDGVWRFELGEISLLVDGFIIKGEKHYIKHPEKAYAYFNIHGHVYGVANEIKTFPTVEDFYDNMLQQYQIIRNDSKLHA
jgi:hypothetical protein